MRSLFFPLLLGSLIGAACGSDPPTPPADMGAVDMPIDQPQDDMAPDLPPSDVAPTPADMAPDMALPDQAPDMPVELCGNGIVDPGEACDGDDFGAESCITQGFTSGALLCTAACEISTDRCDLCGDGTCGMSETATSCPAECAATAVATGDKHSCAVRADGSVWCWGARDGHRAGGMDDVLVPHPIAGITDATHVATGESHTCVIASGDVYCWGLNEFDQLGTGANSREKGSPQLVDLTSDAIHISAGRHHSCATLDDNTLSCWGRRDYGQVNAGVGGLSNVQSSAAGEFHTCATTTQGVYCWGWNDQGQLGAGDRIWRSSPTLAIGHGVSVGTGARHTCAHIVNIAAPPQFSGLYCWGSNGYGQLGATPSNDLLGAQRINGFITSVDGGATFTCGLDGIAPSSVACWGRNDFGQLGDGTVELRYTPGAALGFDNALEIKAGTDHACARLDDGQVRCWGRNQDGQVGSGMASFHATPVAPEGFQ